MRTTHAELIDNLNSVSIALKVHHIGIEGQSPENMEKIRKHSYNPTWKEIDELIIEAIKVLQTIQHDPRKY